jgi:hypothetical protein
MAVADGVTNSPGANLVAHQCGATRSAPWMARNSVNYDVYRRRAFLSKEAPMGAVSNSKGNYSPLT